MEHSQVFDLIVPYQEYILISNKVKILEIENGHLKDTVSSFTDQLQKQKQDTFIIKQCEQKLKVLSKSHIKALKMVVEFQNKQIELRTAINQKDTLLAERAHIAENNMKCIQQLREEVQKLNSTCLVHHTTIQALTKDVRLQQVEAEQLRAQNKKMKEDIDYYVRQSEKKSKRCHELEEEIKRKKIQKMILVENQKDQELNELRQQLQQYQIKFRSNEQQREKLLQLIKQKELSLKQIQSLSPIIQRYYEWLQNPQSKLITTFCLTIQNYRQRLIDSKQFQDVNEHLEIKKKSIDKALQKEFNKILQTSTLLCSLQNKG